MNIEIDVERARKVGKILIEVYYSDKEKSFFGQKKAPEEWFKPKNLTKGSPQHIHYVTLICSLNRRRDADQLWKAGMETFEDEETRWVFDVNSEKLENFTELQKALQKHKLSQRPSQDTEYWQKNILSIKEKFNGDIRKLIIEEGEKDAKKIYNLVKKNYENDFLSLKGDKILPYWIITLKEVCGLELKNLNEIPIPVDVHVARATIFTGCLKGEDIEKNLLKVNSIGRMKKNIKQIAKKIDEVWKKASEKFKEFEKYKLDEPLWTLSKEGCSKVKNRTCSKYDECPVKYLCVKVEK